MAVRIISASPVTTVPSPVFLSALFSPVSASTSAKLFISALLSLVVDVVLVISVEAELSESEPVLEFEDSKLSRLTTPHPGVHSRSLRETVSFAGYGPPVALVELPPVPLWVPSESEVLLVLEVFSFFGFSLFVESDVGLSLEELVSVLVSVPGSAGESGISGESGLSGELGNSGLLGSSGAAIVTLAVKEIGYIASIKLIKTFTNNFFTTATFYLAGGIFQ